MNRALSSTIAGVSRCDSRDVVSYLHWLFSSWRVTAWALIQFVYDWTAVGFDSYGPALVEAGARFLGGCCGTGPEFIKALKARIRP